MATKPGRASLVVYAERKLTMEIQSTDVAALAGVSQVAIHKMRLRGDGPAYVKRGGRYFYPLGSVLRWAIERELANLDAGRSEGRATP